MKNKIKFPSDNYLLVLPWMAGSSSDKLHRKGEGETAGTITTKMHKIPSPMNL